MQSCFRGFVDEPGFYKFRTSRTPHHFPEVEVSCVWYASNTLGLLLEMAVLPGIHQMHSALHIHTVNRVRSLGILEVTNSLLVREILAIQ